MTVLSDREWKTKYTPDDGDLVKLFYVPVLECAVRYDRTTGYFAASALALAARGIEGLVRNDGRMRLIVGCTLEEPEVQAIEKGAALGETVERFMLRAPFDALDGNTQAALEILAWMVAQRFLDVKVAVPCNRDRHPVAGTGIFHEKAGIIEDKTGERLAFSGSINETAHGWMHNWESFHVFTDWTGTKAHVDDEENTFARLWADKSGTALVVDVPTAVRDRLLDFLPRDDRRPARLKGQPPKVRTAPKEKGVPPKETVEVAPTDLRRLIWSFIRQAPKEEKGGTRIGEATSAVTPWPHQIKTFHRLYDTWPPKLLIADEVGLGKTIEAGLLLRQAWLAGQAKRILILAPKAILKQWQIELREKFNLNWPIYDGQRFSWYLSPALPGPAMRKVGRQEWHKEPVVIVSSQLMRRADRARELLDDAEPWDLVVLDEAHHARRRGAGLPGERGPNHLLRLMQGLRERSKGLILLTATPMQVDPVEVWDLLHLLGLPQEWTPEAFRQFFDLAAHPNPSHADFEHMAMLFRATGRFYGQIEPEQIIRFVPGGSELTAGKLLKALCDPAKTPRRQLETDEREVALRIMRANTPVARLVSRHTRELLRRYYKAGKITMRIADREVEDVFIDLADAERMLYEAVEDYISTTYNRADPDHRNVVGFVMTIYRRRLASSFYALAQTLEDRLRKVTHWDEEDAFDDEIADDVMDADETAEAKRQALAVEENAEIERLLRRIRELPIDTKTGRLKTILRELRDGGYSQVMIFTQYTDTMDFLRRELADEFGIRMMCFSGRGGEILSSDGSWTVVSRDLVKKRFRDGDAEWLICTDAAAEGLNFQFCGALVNYDMPWNPMKVEQRIGRIDRLGQHHERIRIINLHYRNTVEADVYVVLRERINLFTTYVGKLQPILAKLPGRIAKVSLAPGDRELARQNMVAEIEADAEAAEAAGFDLDEITASDLEEPARPAPLYDLEDLDRVLSRKDLLPPDLDAKPLHGSHRQYSCSRPGMREPIRVTTDPAIFGEHPESFELWSPGSPMFPTPDDILNPEDVTAKRSKLAAIFRNLIT